MAVVATTRFLRGKLLSSYILQLTNRCDQTITRVAVPCLQVPANRHTPKRAWLHSSSKTAATRSVNEAIVTDEEVDGEGRWMTDLRKRGLYSDSRYGQYHQYKVDNFYISHDKKNVTIEWSDGRTSQFDAIWLRHQCHCPECKHDMNGMGRISWDALPMDITVLSAELEGDKLMEFRWGTHDGKELHKGAIPTATLRCYCYSNESIKDRRQRRAMLFHEHKVIPKVEYEEFHASEQGVLNDIFSKGFSPEVPFYVEGRFRCLKEVNERGICLVKNTPTNMDMFKKTLQMIGPIQSTMYGETFEVVATPNPINAAYSSEKLHLHMDLPFYETAPGLQILHCWRFDSDMTGGSNTFLDIHEVAHQFRAEHPELFDRLTRLPVNYHSIHYNRPIPVHMENQKTIFSLNHFGELVSVTWHPMVTGPTELPKEDMVPFYEAYTAFFKMVSESEKVYKFKFEAGDFLIFNNRRVLHGRDGFSGGQQGGRHLQGAYLELSDFHSRVQALHNKYGDGRLASRSGSHSWF